MYAQIRLSDHTVIGASGPLPDVISAWAGSDALLSDLTGETDPAFGFEGTGFWPVIVTTPAFDTATQALEGGVALGAPDPDTRTVPGTATLRSLTAAEIAADLAEARAAKTAAIEAGLGTLMDAGAPVAGGLHIALTDSARADLGAMATTAIAALSGALPWPDSYQQGWIAVENTRIALASPADGLRLAAGVGDYYAKCRQNGRSLKDAVLAAADRTALEAVDVTAGWPPTA